MSDVFVPSHVRLSVDCPCVEVLFVCKFVSLRVCLVRSFGSLPDAVRDARCCSPFDFLVASPVITTASCGQLRC